MKETLYKTVIESTIKPQKSFKNFKKALADYFDDEEIDPTDPFHISKVRSLIESQPDLLYNSSVFVSEGGNANNDVFLRDTLFSIFKTPRNKLVNYEHDTHGQDSIKNPKGYQVVGHIYDSLVATQAGEMIPEFEIVRNGDSWLADDSPFKGKPVDILVAWVLYQFEFPKLADLIMSKSEESDKGFGVSMEVLFSDYKFRVGHYDATEPFDKDGNELGYLEAKKGSPMGLLLEQYWKKRKPYEGKPVYRIPGGTIFFSGMAITGNKAGERSFNIAVASASGESRIDTIIKAVASKNKGQDFSACEIIDGEPNCECLELTVASQLQELEEVVTEISLKLKGKAYYDDEDEEEDYRSGIRMANKKLNELYENNLDNELSGEEIREYIEEIEGHLYASKNSLDKILKTS